MRSRGAMGNEMLGGVMRFAEGPTAEAASCVAVGSNEACVAPAAGSSEADR